MQISRDQNRIRLMHHHIQLNPGDGEWERPVVRQTLGRGNPRPADGRLRGCGGNHEQLTLLRSWLPGSTIGGRENLTSQRKPEPSIEFLTPSSQSEREVAGFRQWLTSAMHLIIPGVEQPKKAEYQSIGLKLFQHSNTRHNVIG